MSGIIAILKRGHNGSDGSMAITDHIEDLRWHIIRSLLVVILVSIFMFFNIEWIFDNIVIGPAKADFISYRVMCTIGNAIGVDALCMGNIMLEFQNTELSGQFMMSFSMSFIFGLIVAFPYVFFELWSFIKPALKANEVRSAKGIIFWVSLLFFTGVLFAYFIVAPFTISFFATYQLSSSFRNIIKVSNYYDTICDLVVGIGLIFELPVVVYFLSKIGLTTPKYLREKRNYAILIILVLAAVITPPDWLSIWLVAIPLFGLYELSIRISARAQVGK